MSASIFIPVENERVFDPSDANYHDVVRQEVVDWLNECCSPYYVCRRDLYGKTGYMGVTFYFSKDSAAAMFKLTWGGT